MCPDNTLITGDATRIRDYQVRNTRPKTIVKGKKKHI